MKRMTGWGRTAMLAVPLALAAVARPATGGCGCEDDDDHDGPRARETAARAVVHVKKASKKGETVEFKLLGLNDFHGQLSKGKFVGVRPVGSAPVLASYLLSGARDYGDRA